jgi:heptosyltransferase-2
MGSSFLIIQTAFTGDAILATSLAESIHNADNSHAIDLVVRKGNESLFKNHPFLRNVLVWDKRKNKFKNLLGILKRIRSSKYDVAVNLQRFASTGLLTACSNAKIKTGFSKNPLSPFFSNRHKHIIQNNTHEIDRNFSLVSEIIGGKISKPKLYPDDSDYKAVEKYKNQPFYTISPSSVWFTKTFPPYKWIELIKKLNVVTPGFSIFLLGSKDENTIAQSIKDKSGIEKIHNLCGSLSLLESAALMRDAEMNYVNDSAPMHLAGAMNAPVTAVFCSTVPDFGFGPVSDNSTIIQTTLNLSCRPCGLHGYKQCPLAHFKCAHTININDIVAT